MRNTAANTFVSRSSEWEGDMTVWLRGQAEDNGEQMERLRRNLRRARTAVLTPRQQEMLTLYYDRRITIPKIARMLEVNPSTVSRTIRRAQDRLYRYLQYSF